MPNARQTVAIPEPTADPKALLQSVLALKQAVEVLTRQIGPIAISSPTWQELVNLGVIKQDQIPISRT